MNILEINNLKAYYRVNVNSGINFVKAVDGVTFSVHNNEILGIAGESGCGKSTLIKALYGLFKPPLFLKSGQIVYDVHGKKIDITKVDTERLRDLYWTFLSYIPQSSMNVLNPTMRIKDQLLAIIKYRAGYEIKDTKSYIEEHITNLGLPVEVLNSYPHQLSGGMRQRVTIAMATLLRPSIIFADEFTTALDVIVQRVILQLVKRLQKSLKNTIIMVTHDMGVHAEITDRLLVMYAGNVVELAPTEEMFESPIHPYTYHLIQSLPRIGDKKRRTGVGGSPPSLLNPPSGCRFHPRCPLCTDICKKKVPQLIEVSKNHYVACHLKQ